MTTEQEKLMILQKEVAEDILKKLKITKEEVKSISSLFIIKKTRKRLKK